MRRLLLAMLMAAADDDDDDDDGPSQPRPTGRPALPPPQTASSSS